MSSIYFTVNTDIDYTPDNYEINVTKIELRGVKNTGIFDQGLVDADNRVTRVNTEWPGWTVAETSPVKTYLKEIRNLQKKQPQLIILRREKISTTTQTSFSSLRDLLMLSFTLSILSTTTTLML